MVLEGGKPRRQFHFLENDLQKLLTAPDVGLVDVLVDLELVLLLLGLRVLIAYPILCLVRNDLLVFLQVFGVG